MGLTIKTNKSSINVCKNLNKANSKVAESVEKLSTGMRINRSADDASGLAISEKMKAQIVALETAENNCEDGISLIQTAEGYMGEIHDMLNRMTELAMKSANGVLEDGGNEGYEAYGVNGTEVNAGTDRHSLQLEMDNLCAEIDRIAMTANFNNNKLFYPNSEQDVQSYKNLSHWNDWATLKPYNDFTLQIGETSSSSDKLVVRTNFMTTDALFMKTQYFDVKIDGNYETIVVSNNANKSLIDANGTTQPYKGNLSKHDWGCTLNISDQDYASSAVTVIRKVIDDVSMQRAELGALQNRLEHTVNNLNTTQENIQASNSRIRDTDMAKEMMKYTQSNILVQAGQSMLAQANSQPQSILQLLQ